MSVRLQTAKENQGVSDVSWRWLIGDRWLSGHQVRLIYPELFCSWSRLLGPFRWSVMKENLQNHFSRFSQKKIFPQCTGKKSKKQWLLFPPPPHTRKESIFTETSIKMVTKGFLHHVYLKLHDIFQPELLASNNLCFLQRSICLSVLQSEWWFFSHR